MSQVFKQRPQGGNSGERDTVYPKAISQKEEFLCEGGWE